MFMMSNWRRPFKRKKGTSALQALAWYSGGSMSVPVTKFSLRMYGSQKAVEQEQKRQEKAGKFVIHPYSNFRFYWDCITLLLLIVSMLIIPVAITFFNEKMATDTGWIVFNLCLDFWFLSDIVMNFHTGIIVESGDGDVILDLRTIRFRYLRSWFAIDLVSTLPVDYVLQVTSGGSAGASASRAMKLFRFAKIISLLRLLRISRLIRYVHQWEQIVGMQYDLAVAAVRIFNLVCLMLLIGHWNGCLQFLVPMLYDFPEDSWIIVDDLKEKPWAEQYSWCVFKAMSHMLCIGYGQQPPKNLMDLWMTMLSMVSGAVCFAMFIGHATALIQSMDSSKRQYKEKYMQVKEYMRYRRLPKSLRQRVYGYYENRFQGKMFDEQGILDELSNNLREEVVNYNCRHLVASVPFFSNAEPDFVTEVVQKLKFEVFQPKDVIIREGAIGKKMFFIQHGVVEIRKSELDDPIKQLSDGSYFGEICLLTNDRRVASVIAVSYCSTYSLHVEDFNFILSEHPVMRKTLERVAAARLSRIGKHNTALDERVKESNNLCAEANDIADEIVRHDDTRTNGKSQSKKNVHYRYPAANSSLLDPEIELKTSRSLGSDLGMSFVLTPLVARKHSRCEPEVEIESSQTTSEFFAFSSPRKRAASCSKSLQIIPKQPRSVYLAKRRFTKPRIFSGLKLRRPGAQKFMSPNKNIIELSSNRSTYSEPLTRSLSPSNGHESAITNCTPITTEQESSDVKIEAQTITVVDVERVSVEESERRLTTKDSPASPVSNGLPKSEPAPPLEPENRPHPKETDVKPDEVRIMMSPPHRKTHNSTNLNCDRTIDDVI